MVPMTPEAKAKWLAECAAADKELAKQPLVLENTDKYCFDEKVLEKRENERKRMAENPVLHEERKQYCRDYRKKNLEKCKKGQHDWYQRNKKSVTKKQKAARDAKKATTRRQSDSGAKENTLTQL